MNAEKIGNQLFVSALVLSVVYVAILTIPMWYFDVMSASFAGMFAACLLITALVVAILVRIKGISVAKKRLEKCAPGKSAVSTEMCVAHSLLEEEYAAKLF